MAAKIPIRTVYTGSTATGLAEFQSGEFMDYGVGGTGLTSLGTAGQVLKVNSGATAIEWGSIAGDIEGVTAGTGLSGGGTSGTVSLAVEASQTQITALGTIATGTWEATDVAVAHGGTGASTESAARTNLGVAIGSDVQAYDADLAALAGLTSAADKGIQFTGTGTAATYDLTTAGKALLDDADAAAQIVTLGVNATAAELNIMDGGTTATSTTLADADRVVVNDDGTMVQVAMTDFETYFESALDTLNNVTSASSLGTVGTITSGTWQGTAVADAYVADDLTISGGTVDNSVIGGTTPAAITGTQVDITAQGDLRLQDTTGGQYVALQAPGTVSTSWTVTLPAAVGSSGQALRTSDANGTLEWFTPEVGDITGVTAGTGLSGGGTSGTVSLAIDSTVTTLSGTQTLTNKTLTSPDINTPDIDGGTIDGATIATSDVTVGAGKTLDVSTGTLTLANNQISGDAVEGGTIAATTITTLTTAGITASADIDIGDYEMRAQTFESDVATGTAPFTVASTTKVTNLNADLLDGMTTIDEDNMASDSDTSLPTQQSVKAYVDSQVTAQDLDVTSDSGTIDVDLDSETLTIAGTSNEIETSASGTTVTIGLPNDVTIAGNLTVSGTQTTVSSTTIEVADPLLSMATNNNTTDAVDIGFYGLYDTSGSQDLYSGLFRDASDSGKWKLFKDNQAAPTTTVNTSGTGYAVGTLVADLEGDVTGDVTGDLTGNVSGDVTGDLTGNVSGDVTGNVSGDVTGNVTGDVTGNADTSTALATGRTISSTGDVVWTSASFDGSGNVTGTAAIGTGVIVDADVNASAAIDATKIADGSVTSTEFQYINSLTSNAQTQLDTKATKGFSIAMGVALG